MRVVLKDLPECGARWILLGDEFVVDPTFLDEFRRENPDVSDEPPWAGLGGIYTQYY